MADPLWTSAEIARATSGTESGEFAATGVSIDTRTLEPGDLFVALAGARDGHEFISQAMARGAAGALVSQDVDAPFVKVTGDVLAALEKLGVAARDRATSALRGAVTGSVGKTSVTQAIMAGLKLAGPAHSSVKSYNNHIGVPLTLARMPADTERAVFEVGMNHADEIRPLVGMVRPHIAMITTIAPAHLGNFRDLEEIAAAKAEIFEGVVPGGHAILNRDNAQFAFLEKAARAAGVAHIHSFGADAQSEFRLLDFQPSGEGGLLRAAVGGQTLEVPMGAPGRHIAENAVAVLGAVHLAGGDIEKAMGGLAGMQAEKGRGRRYRLAKDGGVFTLIDESYNANPASMRAAIALLRDAETQAGGRRIAVLGDMLEMGEHSPAVHAGLAEPLLEAGISEVWLGGPDMASLADALPEGVNRQHRATADDLAAFVLEAVRAGDVLVVKSSKGTGFSRIVAALLDKYPAFSERERET